MARIKKVLYLFPWSNMWVHLQTAALGKVSTEPPVQDTKGNSILVKSMTVGL